MKTRLLLTLLLCSPLYFAHPADSNTREETEYILRMQEILRAALKLHENQGLTFAVNGALPFAGTSMSLEAMNLGGNLSLFCSSSASLRIQNNAAISVGVGKNYARGCEVARKYEGFSISLSGGAGVDVIAGASVAGSVSYAIDMQMLIDTIRTQFINNPKNILVLLKEIHSFQACLLNQELAATLDAFLFVIARAIEANVATIPEGALKDKILDELEFVLNGINSSRKGLRNYAHRSDCGLREVPQRLEENGKKIIDIYKSALRASPNPAALVPGKEQLALLIESIVDRNHFPYLRKLLLEIMRRDFTNCNRVELSGALGASTPAGVSFSLAASLKHIKQIGPILPLRDMQEAVIDRYVQRNGFKNFYNDNLFVIKQVCKAHRCAWTAVKKAVQNPREAIQSISNSISIIEQKRAELFTQFLNTAKECTLGNYKDLVTEPFKLLLAPGESYD